MINSLPKSLIESAILRLTHIDVDGEMKHKYNSDGNLVHTTDAGIKNFHRWFGNSTAVDATGRPQVFSHTTSTDWDSFDMSKTRDSAVYGKGIYLSPNKQWESKDSTVVKKLYLKTNKPLDLTGPMNAESTEMLSKYAGRPVEAAPLLTMEKRHGSVCAGAHAAGFDSILHMGPGSTGKHIVAFHPSQIKSATNNNGDFVDNEHIHQ